MTNQNQSENANQNQSENEGESGKQHQSENETGNEKQDADVGVAEDSFEDKYNDLNNKYLRLYSEFENFRKRTAKEKLDIIKNAGGDVVRDMLSVMDDFERAIKANADVDDSKALKDGFELIHNKFKKTLESKGLKEIKAMGETFDVDIHEAITQIPADKKNKGKVVDVVEKGYYLNDTVLRYSKVVVGQ